MARTPKQVVTIQLPNSFIEFMREVQKRISNGDKSTTIESDDLLQCAGIFGGLYNAAKRRFGFCCYYADDEQWDIHLDAVQIAAIADGTLFELGLWKCSGGQCKCLYATEDSYCMYCDSIRHFDDYESRLRIKYPDKDDEFINSRANLRKIGLAIGDYRNKHGNFPPAVMHDVNGTALHSWRSLILPYLDEEDVFQQINFSQSWDSAANRKIWDQRPMVYSGSANSVPMTSCIAIAGSDTIWPMEGLRRLSDITSGYSNTVAAIAVNHSTVNWMEPRDMDIDAAISEYQSKHSLLAVLVDGHVRLLEDVDTSQLRELFSI